VLHLLQINEPRFFWASCDCNLSKEGMMSVHRHTLTIGVFVILATGIVPAIASKRVPKTITGCVFSGAFVSSDGYDIHPRDGKGHAIDLRPFEGHTVTIIGELLPGDAFVVGKPPRDSGPCTMMRPAGK
jgi:hypothetical protein